VVLSGAAGVGKSRLAHEVLARAAGAGSRVEWIAATATAAHVPLGAAAHLVPSDAISETRDDVLHAIVATLQHEADDRGLWLGVDDAHLLDDASAVLVQLLATNRAASVVVTVRSGEPVPDSIGSLWKDDWFPMMVIQALSRREVDDLTASVLAGPVDGSLRQRLWDLSNGNALFLREVVRHGLESGALRVEDGLWRWPDPFAPGDRLADLVGLRMGSLSAPELDVLELVAVGEPLRAPVLRTLAPAEVVGSLERRGVVTSRSDAVAEVRLAHPLFGEVVRDRMPATRLDEIRLDLAHAVEASDPTPAESFRAAVWRADAGDHSRPEQLRMAAQRSWAMWDGPLAERLARAALESGPDLEAGYLLGAALSRLGRAEEALVALTAVRDLPGPDQARAGAAIAEAGVLTYQLGRTSDAVAVLRDARARIDDPDAQRLVEGTLGALGTIDGSSRTLDLAALADTSPPAAMAAAINLTLAGQLDLAVQIADRAIADEGTWAGSLPSTQLRLHLARVWARILAGDVIDAEAEAERRHAAAVRDRADMPRIGWSVACGLAAVLRGHPRSAAAVLREAVAVMGSDDRGWGRALFAYLTMAAAMSGEPDDAAAHEARAEDANRSIDVFAVEVARSHACASAGRGELSAAVTAARAAADVARRRGQHALEALALHEIVRLGRAAEVVDRLTELATLVDGVLVDALATHARAANDDDGAALDRVADTFASLGLDLTAAEAYTAAARSHRGKGRTASASASRERARLLAERCEGAWSPVLTQVDDAPDLTGREREVADLAASGLSSRVIGERLGITTRTVDNLLGRVYVKLGLTGRSELVEVLGRRGP
jgi:DNA-binding CsgD family transcriptional regulator